MSVAELLLERLGLSERIAGRRAGKVLCRCPLPAHEDRRPSAAVFDSGVLACARCGRFSPFDWILELGLSRADAMALLVELELRAGNPASATNAALPLARRTPVTSDPAGWPRPRAARSQRRWVDTRRFEELPERIRERVAASVADRRRYDDRLGELRGFVPDALDLAGVGIGRAAEYGFVGPWPALDELRLLVPGRDELGRIVGLLAIAPNPEQRAEPKLLALARRPRTLLELAAVPAPIAPMLLVAEGELDALAAASVGIPAVGVPGVGGFDRHAARIAELVRCFGLELALLMPDADEAGRRSFRALASAIGDAGATAVFADVLPDGADVGTELVRLAAELELVRPELATSDLRREAGRQLLAAAGVEIGS